MENASGYKLPEMLEGTVLEKIVRAKVLELDGAMKALPAASLESVLDRAPEVRSFHEALTSQSPAIIAEIKKASPSAGVLRDDFDPVGFARDYQEAGAAALSVITEARYFLGALDYLAAVRLNSRLPLLRKDFIIDRYQVLEARRAGADAVLLIAALLDESALENLRLEAEHYGMEALVEVHSAPELERALGSGATLIGVNNRDLRTFEVSLEVSLKLASRMPAHVVAVAESGIRSGSDLRRLAEAGYRGFLVGEQLMRAKAPGAALRHMIEGWHAAPADTQGTGAGNEG